LTGDYLDRDRSELGDALEPETQDELDELALSRSRATGRVVAIVHPWELLDEPLPRDSHDRAVDAVISAGAGLRSLATGSDTPAGPARGEEQG